MKNLLIIIVAFLFVLACQQSKAPVKQVKTDSSKIAKPKIITPEKKQIYSGPFDDNAIEYVNTSIDALEKMTKNEVAPYEVNDIIKWVDSFNKGGTYIRAAIDIVADPKALKIAKAAKSKIIAMQIKWFPKLRKAYAEKCKILLWENDITVEQNGTTLTFIGGIFATNANKRDFQEKLRSNLNSLRFKRINYKWIRDDDNYTYYKLSNFKDNELYKM